jgi:hypothetical protein
LRTEARVRAFERGGTVGAVARDARGGLAAATSTGGTTGKHPGRVGDSPLVAAGTWADDETAAVSCTGDGEAIIRAALAHEVDALMRHGGRALADAGAEAVAGLERYGGDGGLVAVAAAGGVTLGLIAGYYEGWVDQVISRILELVLSFPELLFAIAIVALLGPSLDNLIVAFGLFGWPGYARIVRGSVLSARRREYVEAARAIGARGRRIMFRHILPNVIAPVIILSATRFGGALLAGSGLSFIGLGVPIPQPEWGAIMATGRDYYARALWITLFPGALITLAVLGVNLLGDGLRDILDPRMGR